MTATVSNDGADITLKDVIVHMNHMEVRLKAEIKSEVGGLRSEMKDMEFRLTRRMDSMQEDLEATMRDTVAIRKHVGMSVPDEE